MRKNYNYKICKRFSVFALLFIFPFFGIAQKIKVTDYDNAFSIRNADAEMISFKNQLSTLTAIDVNTGQGVFSRISAKGFNFTTEEGAPQLPVLKKLIELPYGATPRISITNTESKTISLKDYDINALLFPAQPSVSKSDDPENLPFIFDEELYEINDWYGRELVKVVDLGMMRGVRIARIEISPVMYNPVTGDLRIATSFDCTINFVGAQSGITEQEKARVFSPWFEGVFSSLINHQNAAQAVGDALIDEAPATYIIVADPMFESSLESFVEWKTRKGFRVVEAYTDDPSVGTTTTTISNYLSGFYNNPPQGYSPQSFVLLVGDVAQIPAFSGTAGSHVTDLYYCEYSGDIFPECFYGRFSAENLSQLQPQIDKTLEYEQYAFPDPAFLDEVVMVAGADASHQLTWGNGQINYGTQYYFNAAHGLYANVYLQPEPSGGNYSENIRQNVSDGVAYANYSAHCSAAGWADPSFTTSHISALTNSHRYPLMVGNCCSSVEFQTTCFGEEILRASLKGAVGYIGGSNSTYWDEDFWWGVGVETISANPTYNAANLGAYDRAFHDQSGITTNDWYITQGQMPSAGNLAVSQAGSSLEDYYWEIYHLMGDPSLMIYFSQPPAISASYPAIMPLASESFTVNCDPYACVAISRNGVLYGAAVADATGKAEVGLNPIAEPGEAEVVITGQNLQPYFGTVMVASPTGPYISLGAFTMDDANGNGQADYGEMVYLDVDMENLGSEPGANVTLSLSSESNYVLVVQSSAAIQTINAGEIISLDDAFLLSISEDVPDGEMLNFNLDIVAGSDTWQNTFSFEAHAPVLEYSSYTISDPGGNGNGKLDPGETVNLLVEVANSGSAAAHEVFGALNSSSQYITILSGDPQPYGDLDADASATAAFQVSCTESTPTGQSVDFEIALTAQSGITGQGSFSLVAGQIPVLVIDLDENNNSGSAIVSAMNAHGINSEYTTSIPTDLDLYSNLFVCLGVYSSNHTLSSTEGQALADYLNQGGNLYMEGGDTWYYDDQTAVHSMFGINGVSDGSGDLGTVLGISGTMTEGMSYAYSGDNNWIDHLEATGTGELIMENQSPNYGCAIANTGSGYKTIGTSFEFGGLSADSDALMEKFLLFFDLLQTLQANFTSDVTEINTGESVQFTNLSAGNPISFAWTFEGGTPSQSTAENPQVTYAQQGVFDVELIISDGLTASTHSVSDMITVVYDGEVQSISIPEGWSGISSCLVPGNTNFNNILGLNLQNVVLIQSMDGVFYPEYEVNTLGEWDYQSGYMIKAETPFVLDISGTEPASRQLTLEEGWNIMPVISPCGATVGQLFGLYLNKVNVVKSIAGTEVFWPQFNINTLGAFEPGKAYFVNVSQQISITFPDCD